MQERQQTAGYICPRTRTVLRSEGDMLRSDDGTLAYPVRNGIPQFLHYDTAEDEATVDRLQRLNQLATERGWEPALTAVYGHDPSMIRYVTDTSRASFIDLLPLSLRSDVLEIGPGLGQFTPILARRSRQVSALEIVPDQAKFAAERCRQQGIANVDVAVGGDDCRLPYQDEAFDLVVLNLVFEWCAWRCDDEQFADVQRRFLEEISRVIKPGGSLYLTTKNRFALRYLLGKSDEHCHQIPFGSALPRWVARGLMKLKGHSRPLGMLYSHNALQGMLERVGLNRAASFWAAPEMRYPKCYVLNDAASIRAARQQPGFVQGESRSSKVLMRFIPAPLVKHFTPGLAFLATKSVRALADDNYLDRSATTILSG